MLNLFQILIPGIVAPSLRSDRDKPSISGFNFMREIVIKSKKHGIKSVFVDDEDYEKVSAYGWAYHKLGNVYYATRHIKINGKAGLQLMHRFILGIEDNNIIVDHRDHNGINNQKHNLRVASKSQNNSNRRSSRSSTSIYLGVTWHKAANKWLAKIRKNGEAKHLGVFECEIAAAKAYDVAAKEIHGEFANLNFNDL